MDPNVWVEIPEFPDYSINVYGEIWNRRRDIMMRTSLSNFGHAKITLTVETERYDRSVAKLVAEAFVAQPDPFCDCVIVLDGDLSNVRADNLAWRTRAHAWNYRYQLGKHQPAYYRSLPVEDVTHGHQYESVIHAGMRLGLLFDEIWRSTYQGSSLYPTGSVFQVIKGV